MAEYAGYHANKYSADSGCEFCDGIIRCEPWCIKVNPNVYHAYEMVANPEAITESDKSILHVLRVRWTPSR